MKKMAASCSFTTTNEPPDGYFTTTLQESGVNKFLQRRNVNSALKSQQLESKNTSKNYDDFSEYRRLCEGRIRRLERYKKTKSLISLYSTKDSNLLFNNNNFLNYDLEEENKQNLLQNACSHGNLFYPLSTNHSETIFTSSNKKILRDNVNKNAICICCSRNSTLPFNINNNNINYQNSNYLRGTDDSIFVDSENPNFAKHLSPQINCEAESRNLFPLHFQSQRTSTDLMSSCSSSDYANCSTASEDASNSDFIASKLTGVGKSQMELSSYTAREDLLLRRKSAIDTPVNFQFEMLREKMVCYLFGIYFT